MAALHCPRCGAELAGLGGNSHYCKYCRKQYDLGGDGTASYEEERRSGVFFGVILALVFLLGLLIGLFFLFYFGDFNHTRYSEKEYNAYLNSLAAAPPGLRPASGLKKNPKPEKGEPARVLGVVDEVGENELSLDGGVDCYFIPDSMDEGKLAELDNVLSGLEPGDVVEVGGLVCGGSPYGLKYCGIPNVCYGGRDYYDEYVGYCNGHLWPGLDWDDGRFALLTDCVGRGDFLALSASEAFEPFRTGGRITRESYADGAAYYTDRVLRVDGVVEEIGDTWIIINNIWCFFFTDTLCEADQTFFSDLSVGDAVTLTGLVSSPSCYCFRLNYCYFTEPPEAGTVHSSTVQTPEPAPDADGFEQFNGVWESEERFYYETATDSTDAGPLYYVKIDIQGERLRVWVFSVVAKQAPMLDFAFEDTTAALIEGVLQYHFNVPNEYSGNYSGTFMLDLSGDAPSYSITDLQDFNGGESYSFLDSSGRLLPSADPFPGAAAPEPMAAAADDYSRFVGFWESRERGMYGAMNQEEPLYRVTIEDNGDGLTVFVHSQVGDHEPELGCYHDVGYDEIENGVLRFPFSTSAGDYDLHAGTYTGVFELQFGEGDDLRLRTIGLRREKGGTVEATFPDREDQLLPSTEGYVSS